MIEQILAWLRSFPALAGIAAEELGPESGAIGLFCRGREVLWERRDILGGRIRRQKVVFLLACHVPNEEPLSLALELEPLLQSTAPVLGEDQRVLLEQGRTVKNDGSGLLRMEARLTMEYTTKEESDNG